MLRSSIVRTAAVASCGAALLLAPVSTAQAEEATESATVVAYPAPAEAEAAPEYEVRASGKEVFVYQSPVAGLAPFSFSGKTEVTVIADREIENVAIRPLSRGIEAQVKGKTLRFILDQPANLSIEINDDIKRPLFLFANPLETGAPDPSDSNVLYFEGGKIHEPGEIRLRDGMTVHIAGGAVVRGTIRGEGARDARVTGRGILDATTRNYQTKMIELTGCEDIELDGIVVLGSFGWTVVPRQSRNIRISNVKIVGWRNNDDGIDITGSRNVTIDGCFIRTKDDCIAIKAVGDHRYFAPPGPDAGTPAVRPAGTRTGEHDVRNVRVTDSVLWNAEWGNAIEIGFELRTPSISDIVFKNCDIIRVERGAVFSVNNGDYATVENIRFENIRVEDARDRLLDLRIGLSIYSEDCPWEFFRGNPERKSSPGGQWIPLSGGEVDAHVGNRGRIRNLYLKNIRIFADAMPGSHMHGFGHGRDIENIVFENVTHRGRLILDEEEAKIESENTDGIRFER